jgi:hypothetical protein
LLASIFLFSVACVPLWLVLELGTMTFGAPTPDGYFWLEQ